MKILFVSVFGYHFFNWVLQLKNSGHEVYWIDVNDANTYVKQIDFVHQTVKWKNRWDYPGRQRIKKNFPTLNNFVQKFNQREFKEVFREKIEEIQPDAVHSFEMFSSCVPILEIMEENPQIKWIYTTWGSDLFFYRQYPDKLKGIESVFQRLEYMFADCNRDLVLASNLGFKGVHLGTFPGGGGYDLLSAKPWIKDFSTRKSILIKGYQNRFGRCINVLEALLQIKDTLKDYKIVVFGAPQEVLSYVDLPKFKKMRNLNVKGLVGRGEVFELMGESLIYIGNSISDGMPNTLLEAIVMESFPIQSNPGRATSEIVEHGKNGYLIENPENSDEIATLILKAIQNPQFLKSGVDYNSKYIKPYLEREYVKERVLSRYNLIEQKL